MNAGSPKLRAQSSREAPGNGADKCAVTILSPGWWEVVVTGNESASPNLALRDDSQESGARHPWDLEERVALFGGAVVRFSKKIPHGSTNDRLISQLAGAGTSTGANDCEANQAVSQKDFTTTIGRCLKEAKETKFFLRMIVASEPGLAEEARMLHREAHELLPIFGAMRKRGPHRIDTTLDLRPWRFA